MAMELFKTKSQLFMLHVPYRGTAGYTQDLLAGELMVGFLPVHIAQGFVNAGKLNALAVGSPKRHPVAPNVATFAELGIKGVEVDLWYAFFAPNKTPVSVVNRLNTEIAAILKLPEVSDQLKRAGMDATTSTTDELTQLVNKDYPRWGEVIRRNGITAE
jgi:tripartite-type tricarboxylate transporter receptor subunit TctC